jgi:hypothetical protein
MGSRLGAPRIPTIAPRMPYNPNDVLFAAVPDDFREELARIVASGILGRHWAVLLEGLRHGRPAPLFLYGMEQLPTDDARPDDALAAFFIVLSELGICRPELRILATKCMEYCECVAADGWSESLAKLRRSCQCVADDSDATHLPGLQP